MSGSMDDAIGELWAMFAPTARARVDMLEDFLTSLHDGSAGPERAEAASAAHKLAGSLGSYLRPGSDAAAELEQLLSSGQEVDPETAGPLMAVLRDAVGSP